MLEFLSGYGMFLLQFLTVVVVIVVAILVVLSAARKQQAEGSLTVEHVNRALDVAQRPDDRLTKKGFANMTRVHGNNAVSLRCHVISDAMAGACGVERRADHGDGSSFEQKLRQAFIC